MTKYKGLAISWFFAPYQGSADFDFFKRIKDTNLEFDVVQIKRDQKDLSLLDYITNAKINRLEVETEHKEPRTAKTRDDFKKYALDYFEKNNQKFDFIISHSNEVPSHAIAYEIKQRKKDLPWIAYFGDLIKMNPYIKYIPGYPLVQEDNTTEQTTIESADLIILNNEYQKELMFSGANEQYIHKAVVIPHCYEPKMYKGVDKPLSWADGKFRLLHLGTLYHTKRTAEPILKAVDRLIQIYPHYKNKFIVEFYGGAPYTHDISVHAFMKNRNQVVFQDSVSYNESLNLMQRADALLLIDGLFNEAEDGLSVNPFFAGKLTDYMGAKKPIMAVTMDKGPSADILKASGNVIADDKTDRIAYVLKKYIDQKVMPDYSYYENYTCDNVAQQMQQAIESVIK
ncbi:hypothetical protein [Nibribacter koreensis]|uniref:Uncharacterized protein n=1 Tax=Nibribacter koreensis TaxID=1084519 RepID=A0ABP8F5G1_9BACT